MAIKVLMVCLGNICRSPLAEGILRNKVVPNKVIVDSAGTAGYHSGEKPDSRSIAVASRNGIDITYQKSRKLTRSDLSHFDLIYAMDKSNYRHILGMAGTKEEQDKVHLLLAETPVDTIEVPDPYYGGEDGFEKVYRLIDDACNVIARRLETNTRG